MIKAVPNFKKVWPGLAASAAMVLAGAGCNTSASPAPAASTPVPTTPNPSAAAPATAANHKDGTFTVDASYQSPEGTDGMDVTLTLVGGVVTDTSLVERASNPKSQEYQDAFAAAYKPLVVGKRLDQLRLDRVSGASLTTAAFNNAVVQIANQTKQ